MKDLLAPESRTQQLGPVFDMGWRMVEGRDAIHKTYTFRNFVEAFGWMTRVSIWAEKLGHHPEWTNVYKTVDVTLCTHDADGLTELDIKLAQQMDNLASS